MKKRQRGKEEKVFSKTGISPWRVLCALIIVGTQIILPITPALADEIVSTPSTVSDTTEEVSVPVSQEEEEVPPEPVPEAEESPALETTGEAPPHTDGETADVTQLEDTEFETESATSSLSIPDESIDSTDGEQSDNSPDESTPVESGSITDDAGSSTIETNGTTTGASSSVIEESVSSTTETLPTLEESPQSPEILPREDEYIEDEATSTDVTSESIATTTGTTSEEVASTELHSFSSDSMYTFNPNECARVADGSFYCVPESKTVAERTDRVFAAADKEGDSEIFIEKDGEISQLTFNQEEDAAPFYDGVSKTIVFHRLIGARYQIVSLDLTTQDEEVLTQDSYNNMQPTRHGDVMVWQGWVGNDWEVMLRKGDDIRMITDNGTHDIGPSISGNYVIWQSESEGGWSVMVYDMETEMVRSVDETDGASIENPRLVLVYDAKHENGDVETRGYDLISEKSVSLHTEAPVLPSELPEPDQTGEERALITSVTQVKSKTGEDDGEPEEVPLIPVIPDTLGTTTDTDTLTVPPFATSSPLEEVGVIDEVLPVLDGTGSTTVHEDVSGDVVIPPSSEVSHIPDLVLPSFDELRDSRTDSQETVAETE